MATTHVSTPCVRRTDASHFSPLADKHSRPHEIPPCARCGAPSLGGRVLEAGAVGTVWDLEFDCGEHGERIFPVMSIALWPYYRVVAELGPGRLRVVRLDRDEAIKRVQR